MENTTVCTVDSCKHNKNEYSIRLRLPNRFVTMSAHSYPHAPGANVEVAFFELSPEDILQIADSIRAVALDLKPELNESLIVGAGI